MDPHDFPTRYGHGVLGALAADGPAVVVTMPEPWDLCAAHFDTRHTPLFVRGIERTTLDALVTEASGAPRVIGLGGGTAIDAAKYVAGRLGVSLYSVPSVASVDACFTAPAAVRDGGRVRYEAPIRPAEVVIDFDVLAAAPAELNRVGIGDLLSIHTGVWDWRRGADAGRPPAFDAGIAAEARRRLEDAEANAAGLSTGEARSFTALFEGFRWVGRTERRVGHCRFEEGCEHYFAYTVEFLTGKRPAHGHLVCLGVALMAELQQNDADAVSASLRAAHIDVRPEALGLTWGEVDAALRALPGHAEREGYAYSAVNERPIDEDYLSRARARVYGYGCGHDA